MSLQSNRFSKLNRETVKQVLYSNPYDRVQLEETDLLLTAAQLALKNIEKLKEAGSRLTAITESIDKLKQDTEALLGFSKPADPAPDSEISSPDPISFQEEAETAPYVSSTTTKPWSNSGQSKRTRRK